MRFSIVNIGCKVNRVEVDAAAAELMARGAQMVQGEPADIVVVNTCTVTAEADKKTRKAVRQALKANPTAQLVVTGCAAVMNPSWFESLDPRIHVVAKPQVADAAWKLFAPDAPHEAVAAHGAPARSGLGFRTRVGIKAQDGCNNACTFCIVHVARGASRSVPMAQVLADARTQAAAGARELVLTGMHIAPYEQGNRYNVDPLRVRTLLMHKKEINKLYGTVKTQQGLTLIPLSVYLDENGRCKIELGLARGKKNYDKREAQAKRDAERKMDKAIKASRNR